MGFTLDKLKRLNREVLPELERVFSRLDELGYEIGARANELERMGRHHGAQEDDLPEVRDRWSIIDRRRDEFKSEIDKISALGAVLLDLERGLVGFPESLDGEAVYLSWQRGETEIGHFHGVSQDFQDRRKLS